MEMFAVWDLYNGSTRDFASKFWEGQSKILDSMQRFSTGWFDRRHVGTRAALEASLRVCESKKLAEVIACYQEWAAGAASRILDDQIAYQQLVHTAVSSMAAAQVGPQTNEEALPFIWPRAA
jgi:hypothetical protein